VKVKHLGGCFLLVECMGVSESFVRASTGNGTSCLTPSGFILIAMDTRFCDDQRVHTCGNLYLNSTVYTMMVHTTWGSVDAVARVRVVCGMHHMYVCDEAA